MLVVIPLLFLTITAHASNENQNDPVSVGFKTGLVLGSGFPTVEEKNISLEENCLGRIADQLESQVQAAGFRYDLQLLQQVADGGLFEKVCAIYDGQQQPLEECARENKVKKAGKGIVALLKLVCENNREVLNNKADCFGDMENNLHRQCVDACRVNAGALKSVSADDIFEDDRDTTKVCTIASCVVRCLAGQVHECDGEGDDGLKNFYFDMSGLQMLLGIESVDAFNSVSSAHSLMKSEKLPAKCRQIIQKSVESAMNGGNKQAPLGGNLRRGGNGNFA